MKISSELYTHEADEATLKTLRAIPVFSQLLKSFMKIWSEKQFALQNMSSNLRLSEKQLPEYYNMLPPICDKLGIEVPELYLSLEGKPNAYTSGEASPFIVITTGLIKTMPPEIIPTVLAHECGHIACHHVLYQTMGRMLLDGTLMGLNLFGISDIALAPLKQAFLHWMRCSEFSADRAAAFYDGSSENIIKMCMTFAGAYRGIADKCSTEAFMEQAAEHKKMLTDSKWNKTLDLLSSTTQTHPLTTVRACECDEWTKSESFSNIKTLYECKSTQTDTGVLLPVLTDSKHYHGMNYKEASDYFSGCGFVNVTANRITEHEKIMNQGAVISVSIGGNNAFSRGLWAPADSDIIISYYDKKSGKELSDGHPGEIRLNFYPKYYQGMRYNPVADDFRKMGFENVVCEAAQYKSVSSFLKEGCVQKILINDRSDFKPGEWVKTDACVKIIYHSSRPSAV